MAAPLDGPDLPRHARTLLSALSLLSRDLPLPPHLLHSLSSILHAGAHGDDAHAPDLPPRTPSPSHQEADEGQSKESLLDELDDALASQRSACMSSLELKNLKETRLQGHIERRLRELEELPSSRGDDLQMKCLLELYGLKLVELQRRVRSDVCLEYWLRETCAYPDRKLYDWGLMRLRRPFMLYDSGDALALEADDRLRKKRDAERLSRLEEEEKKRMETRKRRFFSELLDLAREFQLQAQASLKRRKQRNDGVQAYHARQKQRATRAEKLRIQALKADDQDAYMKLVEESKNERLTMLLGKTNDLLVRLGAAVQRQKDAEHTDGVKVSEGDETPVSRSEATADLIKEEEVDTFDADSNGHVRTSALLEGQRQYNSVIHAIEEKVTEQPCMLQGGELRPYQLEGLQWMLSLFNNNLNGILADEMGLGKTIQTIALIAYLMENKGVNGPHLIVAPKAVLPNWINEFSTWAPGIVAILYDGTRDERKAMMRDCLLRKDKFNVLITHYDFIMRDKAFLKKIHWHYMIVDEGHRLKNHDCALSRTLVSGYRIRRRLLLTGTPIQNSLQELWSLLNFLLPSIFNSVENFEEWFNAPFADKCDVSLTNEEQLLVINRLHHVIRPFLLRRKKDEVEKFLPSKKQVILKCDLSAWQKVYYQQVTSEGRVGLDSGNGKSKSLQNLSMQLRKCCNHPYLFVGGQYNMWNKEEIVRASGKFELLDRLLPKLQRAGHRVLLFSQMTRLMDILEIYLQLNHFKYLRLDGSTKTEERGLLLKKFNAPDSPFFMFLLSTRAGGLGLNLQTADTVIIFDSDWNPQMDQQAEDRAHRIGQKKEVCVFVLVSVGSIEEVILDRAKQKMGIDAKVIQAGLFNTTSTAQDRREMLKEIMRRGTDSLGADVPSERQINDLASRSKEEFWLFEKMDDERRQRENYKTRLMENYEVPDWAYSAFPSEKSKEKDTSNLSGQIFGKRKRKDVVYADHLSDVQWMKAVEDGHDLSKIAMKGKIREQSQSLSEVSELGYDNAEEPKSSYIEIENGEPSESGSEDLMNRTVEKQKPMQLVLGTDEAEGAGSSWHGDTLTWKTHKRKRSTNHGGYQSSSDGKRSAF